MKLTAEQTIRKIRVRKGDEPRAVLEWCAQAAREIDEELNYLRKMVAFKSDYRKLDQSEIEFVEKLGRQITGEGSSTS